MKNSICKNFKTKIIVYTLFSALISIAAEVFLIINLELISDFLLSNGYRSYAFGRDGINPVIKLVVLLIVGIVVFMISFILLISDTIKYVKDISEGISQITSGDLNKVIDIRGDDQFSDLAKNINEMTEEIIVIMDREREAEKAKNELVTSIAHDLRTPLTSIIGYVELLKKNEEIDDETRHNYIDVVYNKSKSLEKLIYDLFEFTKLSHGKLMLTPTSIDIVKLLDQLLNEFYPSFMDNGLQFEFLTCTDEYIIEADGDLIARLFDNLINNAIKYGKDGKLIRVVTQITDDEGIRIDIINYGKVIPKSDLNKIFRRFYRVEYSRSEDTGGTGLGLAIAKNIVDMHGGRIEVFSSLKGTIFSIKLYASIKDKKQRFKV